MALPKITESIIRAGADPQSFQRGQEYYRRGAISGAAIQGNRLSGECQGMSAPYYQVKVRLDEGGIREASCTCPYEFGGYCKHIVALMLAYLHHPKQFDRRKEPADLLADLDHEDLAALFTQLLNEKPELYDWVESARSVPASRGRGSKKKRRKVDAEVYRRQIRGIMHSLDGLRMSEAYWHVGGLAQELRGVENAAVKFLDAGDADTALAILLTLLDEASQGIEYLDDSNGELGSFVGELGQPLAEAILSLELSSLERSRLVDQLTGLVKYAADYGMEGNLHIAIQAARHGWNEIPESSTHEQRARQVADADWLGALDDFDEGEREHYLSRYYLAGPSPLSRPGDLIDAKLNILDRQGRANEYLALCKQARRHLRYALKLCDLKRVPEAVAHARKHLKYADEAHQLAEKLRKMRQVDEALKIGEYGLKLKSPKVRLGEWLGPVEEAQGRDEQALGAWLAAFPENPSLETYKTLQRLAGPKWDKLRPDVIARLRKSFNKQVLAEVLLFEQEWDEAIKVAEGRDVWYPIVETVADGVMKHRPEWVAHMCLKQAERLMAEAKSKNYPIAANWLGRAKRAHALLGQTAHWKAYLQKLKEKYSRRPSLMGHLNRL